MDSLLRAADQFVLSVPGEKQGQMDFVAAHYPWSPPSPRHSLIGFAGLFLVPGKFAAARGFLLAMCDRLADGGHARLELARLSVARGLDLAQWLQHSAGTESAVLSPRR